MKVGDSIRRKGREDAVIQSIVWNSIIEVYKEKKGMDITPYLSSISISGDTVRIKTQKPIIITELNNVAGEIEVLYKKKLLKLGIKLLDTKLKIY